MTNQQQEWLDFAKSVALEAGDVMRRYFGKNSDTHLKADNTIVTVADEEINQLVIQRVVEKYPDHDVDIAAAKIIVEEAGGKVTDLFGREQRYDQDIRGALVSNGVVHKDIVEAMRKLIE